MKEKRNTGHGFALCFNIMLQLHRAPVGSPSADYNAEIPQTTSFTLTKLINYSSLVIFGL